MVNKQLEIWSDKEIRQFLVELTKQRVIHQLDVASDNNLEHLNLQVVGINKAQVTLVKNWLMEIAIPAYNEYLQVLEDRIKAIEDKQKEEKDADTDERGPVDSVRDDEGGTGNT